jgi:hypothetical protein
MGEYALKVKLKDGRVWANAVTIYNRRYVWRADKMPAGAPYFKPFDFGRVKYTLRIGSSSIEVYGPLEAKQRTIAVTRPVWAKPKDMQNAVIEFVNVSGTLSNAAERFERQILELNKPEEPEETEPTTKKKDDDFWSGRSSKKSSSKKEDDFWSGGKTKQSGNSSGQFWSGSGNSKEERLLLENTKGDESDQFIGNVRSRSARIRILCEDTGQEDGDRVRILNNGKVVYRNLYLTNEPKFVTLDLAFGQNRIEIEALNQGTAGPNTAAFKVYDSDNRLLAEKSWKLLTGYKGSLLILKI